MAALCAWLSAECDVFLNRGSVVVPLTTDTDVPEPASSVVTNPASLVDTQVPPSLLWYPNLSGICIEIVLSHSGPPCLSEVGPVRLTRFVEMFLDTFYATVNKMIAVACFELPTRVEGTTAWGV